MESERLAILNENGERLGVASRSEVHKKGYWHETFHCWLAYYDVIKLDSFIYFQLRSREKKDFPGLLDITAAGHILSHEKIEDGVREVHEELGLMVPFEHLQPMGMVKGELFQEGLVDRELSHVFLYSVPISYEEFQPDPLEVAGIFRTALVDFKSLIQGETTEIELEGFVLKNDGEREYKRYKAGYSHFVPHKRSYLLEIINRISAHL
ncbi:NUDIX domain-containing protein [Bacillus sp. MCCB 382]|uniref:NUDIX hydrolase n=1 Tax=Bacillus sp. MCCB 382 TaxID=2860197 RepID=UPI001C589840|nr:NUDIX domain-containing protein [Bacillus sp. MCCB 382]